MAQELTAADWHVIRAVAQQAGNSDTMDPTVARMLITDSLTGLYNRTYYNTRVRQELPLAAAARPLALIVMDINRFKEINDLHGHSVGDRALQMLAQVLRSVCPPGAAPCRLGGDEFVLLAPNTTADAAQWLVAELGQEVARNPVLGEGQALLHISVSVGMALAPAEARDEDGLFHLADDRMYADKRRRSAPRVVRPLSPDPLPLLGRDAELSAAAEWLDQAAGGRGHLLLLSGPPGIGKTRLAETIADAARQRGYGSVRSRLSGRADPDVLRRCSDYCSHVLGRRRVDALARRRSPVAMLLALHPSDGPALSLSDETHWQITEGVRLLLSEAARRQPLVWVVDDLHHADRTLLSTLGQLARNLSDLPVLVIATSRTPAAGEAGAASVELWWQPLADLPSCQRWHLSPLASQAAQHLYQHCLGDPAAVTQADMDRMLDLAAGNPLLIQRLAAGVQTAESEDVGTELKLPDVVRAQVGEMSEPMRMALSTACILDNHCTGELLQQVSPLPMDQLQQGLRDLELEGWLQHDGDRFRFTHPLPQEVVYAGMPVHLRRSQHRLAGHVLAARNADPAVLAYHFDNGEDSARAQDYHRLAAVAMENAGRYALAAWHYRRYLHLSAASGTTPDDAAALAIKTGRLFRMSEDLTSAQAVWNEGLAHARSPAELAQLTMRLGFVQIAHGHNEQAVELLSQSAHHFRGQPPSADRVDVLTVLCYLRGIVQGQIEEAKALVTEAIQVTEAVPNPVQRLKGLAFTGAMALLLPDCAALVASCRRKAEALFLTLPRRPDPHLSSGIYYLARMTGAAGYPRRAVFLFRTARQVAAATGLVTDILSAYCEEFTYLLNLGELDRAAALIPPLERLIATSNHKLRRAWWHDQLFRYCLCRHDLAGAQRAADRYHQTISSMTRKSLQYTGLAMQALLQLARDESPDPSPWAPATILGETHERGVAALYLSAGARVHLHRQDLEAAMALAERACAEAADTWDRTVASWVQGLVYLQRGEIPRAVADFRRAIQANGEAYHVAHARRSLAQALLAMGNSRPGHGQPHRQATVQLQAALTVFRKLGNKREEALTQAMLGLVAAGGRVQDSPRRARQARPTRWSPAAGD